MKRIIMAACIVSLAACGGDKDDVATDQKQEWEAAKASLVYSFPDDGQQQVPTSSPVVLRFSSPVVVTQAALMDLIELRDDEGELVDWDRVEEADGGQSWLLYPESNLDSSTDYQLSIAKIDLEKGDAEARQLSFSTRAAYEGPKSLVAEEEFRILRTLPNDMMLRPDSAPLDVLEFTTFRIQFSQPLERASVIYGNGSDATVQLTGPNGLVDAHVIVSGPYMTIDPKGDLQADAPHKITFTTGLASIYGDTMPGGSFGNPNDTIAQTIDFTPKATGPRASMVQDIAKTPGKPSELTGRQINEVPMASVLLGPDTATQASGIVTAELAFVPDFPDATPLRVKRGSLIEGATIDPVLIGGEVPAGFESGTVRMDFLSDATGYLLPNPYSDADDAPRQVRLWMDVAVSTATPQANGAVTQDLLHIELVGTSLVDPETKRMTINAVGVVEPNVLGSERATGLLSFYMEEVADQDNPPVVAEDTTGPVLQSWTLGTDQVTGENKALLAKPGDPVIFNFNEAIDPESIKGKVRLFDGAGDEIGIEYYIDGSALVIKTEAVRSETEIGATITRSAFQLSPADSSNVYRVEVDGVTDLSGNVAAAMPLVEQFELATVVPDYDLMSDEVSPDFKISPVWDARRKTSHSPVILASYPGFPCALQEEFIAAGGFTGLFDGATDIGQTYRDLGAGIAGVCAGGLPEINDGAERENRSVDDPIPVMDMPANRPIVIVFGKEIDTATLALGKTFFVERINENEDILSEVAGTLDISDMTLTFYPDDPWQKGELYRYTLKSSGWVLCRSGVGSSTQYRIVANDSTEIEPCGTVGNENANSIVVESDHRDLQCGINSICDKEGLPIRTMPLGVSMLRKIPNPDADAIRLYRQVTFGPSLTAGGPNFTHFFRGAEPSPHVLQVLRTQPVADTNRNFISERSSIGNAELNVINTMIALGAGELTTTGAFNFYIEEYGPERPLSPGDPGFGLYPEYDPMGWKPAKNSAKVLSRYDSQGQDFMLRGGNVGCGYDAVLDIMNLPASDVGAPWECPEHKFSYLTSAAVAEVTDVVTERGVKVKLWPSVVMGTALDVYIDTDFVGLFDYPAGTLTGPQVLRMRFSGSGRDEPITGWISEQANDAVMAMDMELYFNAPYAADWSPITNPMNMSSYPIGMSLEGGVTFFDDGRMEVEQYNNNIVNIEIDVWGPGSGAKAGYIDLFIPEYGSRINMISEPIK